MKILYALCAAVACALFLTVMAPAQTPAPAPALSVYTPPDKLTGTPPSEIDLLWPQGAPGALGTAETDKPKILVYLPKENTTHMGILVAPGGSYMHLSMQKEGADIAHWLNDHGIAAFVLQYRLGPQYHHPIEIGDAQRALRLVRSRSAEFGITKLGMWGFSAGGHLAATAGTEFDAGDPASSDPIARQSSRPDFLVLSYPVITMTQPYAHPGSKKSLLGDDPDPALIDATSPEMHVTAQTPPTFLYATTTDQTVPVLNTVMFYEALIKAGVPAEMHIFAEGPHGTNLGQAFPALKVWPGMLWTWLQAR